MIALSLLALASFLQGTERPPLAIENVTVITMVDEQKLAGRTVLVRDGVIERIGPAGQVAVPKDAIRVDGSGRFLLPGLIDMHAHLFSDGRLPDSLAPDEVMVMLANGITSVRLMIGTPEQLRLREAVAGDRVVGPRLTIGSPQLSGQAFGDPFNGRVVTTASQARDAVRELAAAGYDFIKLTFFISREVHEAVVDEARRLGIRVSGHVDPQVGLAAALAAEQQIEHLDGMLEAVLADSAPMTGSVSGVQVWSPAAWRSLDYIDDAKLAQVAARVKAAGVAVTPTLFFLKMAFGEGETDQAIRSRPDWNIIPPAIRREMADPRRQFWANPPSASRRLRFVETRNRLAKALSDAGVPLLAGSDAPEWFHAYGYMYHRELASLAEAGLTPWEVLRAATITAATWLGQQDRIGTVSERKRADLVLLEADPTEDVRHATRIAGVVTDGRWLPKARLDASLTAIASRFAAALP